MAITPATGRNGSPTNPFKPFPNAFAVGKRIVLDFCRVLAEYAAYATSGFEGA
jgi:hypothetical protein